MPPQQRSLPAPAAGDGGGPIVFFHPDLGIGGAERLVVDAAVGLQQRGHRVVIFTNHCDPRHCFDECRDGTLDVRVRGAWLVPPSLFSRLAILCAVLRHVHLILHVTLSRELPALTPRAFVADQLSAGLPLLRCLYRAVPILFYCHFPDLLLVQGRQGSRAKRLYRVPFDFLEQWSMGFAQAVAVNSNFTRSVVERTWPRLPAKVRIDVVYPCVDTDSHDDADDELRAGWGKTLRGHGKLMLSINRFERKKDIGLAIKAFAAIPEPERDGVRLVLAGGYDSRVSENVQYHQELRQLASSLHLSHHSVTSPASPTALADALSPTAQVLFLLSIPNALKAALLAAAHLVVYTPSNEHFGIVPLEAMLARRPVLAANTGGPVETVCDPATGWLRDPDDVPAWTAVMRRALALPAADLARMGSDGARRVKNTFGRDQMADRLDALVADMVAAKPGPPPLSSSVLNLVFLALLLSLGLGLASMYKRLTRN
ncbi:glycosyl transferases group 1 domain-containing protein [Hirsutella rhossiliensis]|uniref:Alpha-1,3/1,6-mannosyltransferase ALG2 n=1 Tax=Hirsutella rhossiliensis TaxID=111463 RepID=A0A9P8N264_9HYPO|nr:glycosyl transferases group 1 domain-containing protein [Hirsutella rhossiliensis]KAH0966283.1 glycosyl transferases group 1 domain-containing protein [Hirsutella rhossiliensis]